MPMRPIHRHGSECDGLGGRRVTGTTGLLSSVFRLGSPSSVVGLSVMGLGHTCCVEPATSFALPKERGTWKLCEWNLVQLNDKELKNLF
jgi:hypothetical protein